MSAVSRRPNSDRRDLGVLGILLIITLGVTAGFLELSAYAIAPSPFSDYLNSNVPDLTTLGIFHVPGKVANYTAVNGTAPAYAQVIRLNRTIIFHSMMINLPVFSSSGSLSSALTGIPVPDYSLAGNNAFTIYGLPLPALVFPQGATLNITFYNLDFPDYHNFVIMTFPPPYDNYMMDGMTMGGQMVTMSPLEVPPVNQVSNVVSAFHYTVTLNYPKVSRMWYTCMFPTHAAMGMWGSIYLTGS